MGILKIKLPDNTWANIGGVGEPGPPGDPGEDGTQGIDGDPGPTGPPGIVISSTPPSDHTVLWADTNVAGDGTSGITSVGPTDIVSIWAGTQTEYDAITTPDDNTLYVVLED